MVEINSNSSRCSYSCSNVHHLSKYAFSNMKFGNINIQWSFSGKSGKKPGDRNITITMNTLFGVSEINTYYEGDIPNTVFHLY